MEFEAYRATAAGPLIHDATANAAVIDLMEVVTLGQAAQPIRLVPFDKTLQRIGRRASGDCRPAHSGAIAIQVADSLLGARRAPMPSLQSQYFCPRDHNQTTAGDRPTPNWVGRFGSGRFGAVNAPTDHHCWTGVPTVAEIPGMANALPSPGPPALVRRP